MNANLTRMLVAGTDAKGRRAQAVAAELGYLWSNLLQRGVLESRRAIGFCSIGDDEGSDALVASLALFLGAKGKRVALVEAALRRPEMSALFGVTGSPGLANLLGSDARLNDVLRSQVAPGVDLVTGGDSDDPFWGFTTERFQAMLRDLQEGREICLVDVPSLHRAPEATLVIRALDAVVLVVEANRHRREVVALNVAHLRSLGTPFLGLVLTDLVHELPAGIARLL